MPTLFLRSYNERVPKAFGKGKFTKALFEALEQEQEAKQPVKGRIPQFSAFSEKQAF